MRNKRCLFFEILSVLILFCVLLTPNAVNLTVSAEEDENYSAIQSVANDEICCTGDYVALETVPTV